MTKSERFGEVALRMGYLNVDQLVDALNRQRELRGNGDSRLIGLVMLESGVLNNFQLVNVLKEMGVQA